MAAAHINILQNCRRRTLVLNSIDDGILFWEQCRLLSRVSIFFYSIWPVCQPALPMTN